MKFTSKTLIDSSCSNVLLPSGNTAVIKTSVQVSNVGVDWLQLHFRGVWASNGVFTVKRTESETKVFKNVSDVYIGALKVGTFTAEPKSPVLNPSMIIFKFDNEILYKYDYMQIFDLMKKHFESSFVSVSRLDVCRDFNLFRFGLKPENLIKRFLRDEYLKIGKGKFKVFGGVEHGTVFDYLRFGTGTSEQSAYLYNKSKELKEATYKPWIVEKWGALGLDVNADVWRLEISLKGQSFNHLDKESGEVEKLDIEVLRDLKKLFLWFEILQKKYFHFVVNDGQAKKTRMKAIELFEPFDTDIVVVKLKDNLKSNRSNKIFLKHLEKWKNQQKGDDINLCLERDKVQRNYIERHGLEKYYRDKVEGAKFEHKDDM